MAPPCGSERTVLFHVPIPFPRLQQQLLSSQEQGRQATVEAQRAVAAEARAAAAETRLAEAEARVSQLERQLGEATGEGRLKEGRWRAESEAQQEVLRGREEQAVQHSRLLEQVLGSGPV